MTTGLSGTREEQAEVAGTDAGLRDEKLGNAPATGPMTLHDLLQGVELVVPLGAPNPEILQVVCDSRKAAASSLFFALHGAKADGNAFLQDALASGAVGIVSGEPPPGWLPANVSWVQVAEPRKALAIVAANFYGHPASRLRMAAVTGTNGKTTVTSLIDAMVKASGAKTGLFGTIAYHTPRGEYPAPNTTPESVDLQGFLAEIRDEGGAFAVLEASSHALTMERLWGCHFAVAVFTNLTREHMDYHKNFEDYFAAKKRLFEGTGAGAPDVAVVNTDDAYGKRLRGLAARTVTYGLENGAEITAKKFSLSFARTGFYGVNSRGKD